MTLVRLHNLTLFFSPCKMGIMKAPLHRELVVSNEIRSTKHLAQRLAQSKCTSVLVMINVILCMRFWILKLLLCILSLLLVL